jgi:hypothetical protein
LHQATVVSPLEAAAARMQLTPTTTDTNSVEYLISKTKVRVSGPVASPLKGRSVGDVSKRVLHLFSPFSPAEPNVPAGATGPANTRAWSTIVGWSPGRSAFPDEHFHEPPQLRLISVSAEKLPRGDSD